MTILRPLIAAITLLMFAMEAYALAPAFRPSQISKSINGRTNVNAKAMVEISRDQWIMSQLQSLSSVVAVGVAVAPPSLVLVSNPRVVHAAAERKSLAECLYSIMRVREAMFQESRLIKTGKFKDVQRANVKLAVKFILNNYRLSDTIINASAFIESNERRVTAGQLGQSTVQDLQTILEYFDSSDVQNIKVDNMSGKERLVLQGLESAGKNIDAFLTYFPKELVDAARTQVLQENELNFKEWDSSLGEIVNLPPAV